MESFRAGPDRHGNTGECKVNLVPKYHPKVVAHANGKDPAECKNLHRYHPHPTVMSVARESEPVARVVEALSYRTPTIGSWSRVPDWARFLIQLGASVGEGPEDSRIVATVATPVRAFAAVLCSVGAVLRLSIEPVQVDVMLYLTELEALPVGTKVVYRKGTAARIQPGAFVGFDEINGQRYIVVDIGGGVLLKIPAEHCGRIEVLDGEAPARRRVASQRTAEAGLAAAAFRGNDGPAFLTSSRLDCVIVAQEREVRAEVLETPFSLVYGNNEVNGYLQDLLRVRRFGRDGDAYRSDLVLTNWRVRRENYERPAVVVFDGAGAYLRWGETWPASHHIVVLDRRDFRFDEAVGQLNAAYIGRFDDLALQLPPAPVSLECMVFRAVPA